jgi:hypothetical protein
MRRMIVAALFALFTTTAAFASGNAILIPAAGHVDGGGGVTFRSDIAVHNLKPVRQFVRFDWLPRAGSGQVPASTTRVMPPNTTIQSDDFVSGVLSTEGLGAIIVQPVHEDGTDDTAAKLMVTSRIWSPSPGHDLSTPGDVSQSFPPITLSSIVNTRVAIGGVRQDTNHRLNVGVVNLDTVSPQTFRIWTEDVVTSTPIELTVPANSMQQIALPPSFTSGRTRVMVEILPAPTGGRLSFWTAYASVVDNITGDSWTSIGVDVTE